MSGRLREMLKGCVDETERLDWMRAFVRTVWVVPAIALLVAVLFMLFGRFELSTFGGHLFGAIVYTALIGMPASFVLNWIGFRWSERWPRGVMALYALALLMLATVGTAVGAWLLCHANFLQHGAVWGEFRSSYPISIVITLLLGLSISSFETMRHKLHYATLELRTREMEQERANKLLAEAKLSSLESRIHPHFLFNTLNSIAALIPKDPKRAEETVARLASLLRFSLSAGQQSTVALEQELKIVRDYLEIEATRFGARLRYAVDADAAAGAWKVPPLALATLVENAVKHAAARSAEGAEITVTAREEAGRLRLEVTDDGPGFELENVAPDHGLGNLAGRLELLYGERAELNVMRREGRTTVWIALPAERGR